MDEDMLSFVAVIHLQSGIPQSCVNAWTGSAMHAGANAKAGAELLFSGIRSLPVLALWYIWLVCISIISTCFSSKLHLSNNA